MSAQGDFPVYRLLKKPLKACLRFLNAILNTVYYLPFGGETAFRNSCCKFAMLKPGERVLDLCCGAGELTFSLANRGLFLDLVGVDISGSAIRTAVTGKADNPIIFIQASVENLPFKHGWFDKCFISFGLHHMPVIVRKNALAEAYRVLSSDGRLYVYDYNSPTGWFKWFFALILSRLDSSREAYKMLKAGTLIDELRDAGFDVTRRELICQDLFQLVEARKSRPLL
jgi:ubiquinone/menaquinone biosynthesis C-methylase UbiE